MYSKSNDSHGTFPHFFLISFFFYFMIYIIFQPHAVAYDDTYLDRFRDPGAGAFSYHEGHRFFSKNAIKAGEELFAGKLIFTTLHSMDIRAWE